MRSNQADMWSNRAQCRSNCQTQSRSNQASCSSGCAQTRPKPFQIWPSRARGGSTRARTGRTEPKGVDRVWFHVGRVEPILMEAVRHAVSWAIWGGRRIIISERWPILVRTYTCTIFRSRKVAGGLACVVAPSRVLCALAFGGANLAAATRARHPPAARRRLATPPARDGGPAGVGCVLVGGGLQAGPIGQAGHSHGHLRSPSKVWSDVGSEETVQLGSKSCLGRMLIVVGPRC